MIVQEPVQAAIWHCLNHYDYSDAIFLAEKLYAEVRTEDSLFLLATSYYRNNQIDHAYHILKDKAVASPQCKYLHGACAYELQKYAEAEFILTDSTVQNSNLDDLITEYGDQAAFVLMLLAKIAGKTERKPRAIEAFKRALKLNPFLWSTFESLCNMGEKPNPQTYFNLSELENLSFCNGTNNLNVVDSVILTNNSTSRDDSALYTNTPQILQNTNVTCNNNLSAKVCTPDTSSIQPNLNNSINLSGVTFLPKTKIKPIKLVLDTPGINVIGNTPPSFGRLLDFSSYDDEINSTPVGLTAANELKSFTKKVRAHVGNLISHRKDILQSNKPVFTQSSNVPNALASVTPSITVTTSATTVPNQNVRRSSRLFSNSYSVKENNKSPSKGKFATPKSPGRKTKQRLGGKCSLYELNNMDLNARNKMKKSEKPSETVTSNNNGASLQTSATQMQKHSAEGLMKLLKELGDAYLHLSQYNCKAAIETLQCLPPNQYNTTWVYSMIAIAYFEMGDYENCVKYFGDVRANEPYRIKYMDIYSTALWHLQREVTLSALAQDLINNNKNASITWIVCGNCFSLHKEHDNAIRFLHRAVQVDPNYPYAYTLLGHEYIMTEELDKALSCYRNAIRLDPRHYNAWFGIGTIYSKQERFPLAEMNYMKAFAINSTNSVIMCHIGVVQHALKKTEKALKTLNHAIGANPKNALCKFHRGSIYFAVGRHAEALKELEELKEIVPKESLVYFLIGKVHKKLGNIDLALMYFSWATGLDPKGASSQMKEGFDPVIERSTEEGESPVSPTNEWHDLEAIQEDSDESL